MIKKLLIVTLTLTLLNCKSTSSVNRVYDEIGLKDTIAEDIGVALESEEYMHIKSLLICKNNKDFFEYYREDITADSNNDIASAVKTVTSTLIGIAVDQGYIDSIDDKFYIYFPDYINEIVDDRFKEISIRDILTMTDGLNWDPKMDWKNISNIDVVNNPVLYSFRLEINDNYLNTFRYSSLNSQLLSALIGKVTGKTMKDFADKNLFNHLNINKYQWSSDEQGNTNGGFGLKINGPEMLRIAKMLVNNGVYHDIQVVSKSWISEMTKIHNDGDGRNPGNYGLHTWIDNSNTYKKYFAMGYGGQFIYIIPELQIAAVITSDFDAHRTDHRLIIDNVVLKSLE